MNNDITGNEVLVESCECEIMFASGQSFKKDVQIIQGENLGYYWRFSNSFSWKRTLKWEFDTINECWKDFEMYGRKIGITRRKS